MGEIALRKIQAGLEVTRGLAVAATRPVYGRMTITREHPRRYANEDRGNFMKNYRANPKLIEAGFKHESDVTFEDLPYWLDLVLQGAITPTGTAPVGYTWAYPPDLTSDTLKTRTFYAGDDTVQWRGAFGTVDSLEMTMTLEDAVTMALEGFVQDWIPVSSAFLTTPFTGGFQGGLADRVVESIMGYQSRLFIDNASGTIGTTARVGRFISFKYANKNNNKRKYFGDNIAIFQKLGRGERDVTFEFVFEGLDTSEFVDHFNNVEKAVRVGLYGTAIAGTTFGTTNGALTAGTAITAITTSALTAAIPGGAGISLAGQVFTVTPAGAAAAATSIPVVSQAPTVTIPTTTTVMLAKTILIDLWGHWDSFSVGNRDTNTTFGMKLNSIADATAGVDQKVTVFNGNNAAAGIS